MRTLQAWSALAHGAKGLAYFVYHSAPGPEEGTLAFDGLRAPDGAPTDRLEALTDLAGRLVPLGPLICRLERAGIPAATDTRCLRAYSFSGPHGTGYAIVYNRTLERSTAGKVRVPFALGEHVTDLVTMERSPVERAEDAATFPVFLSPGEGTIVSLGRAERRTTARKGRGFEGE